MITDSVAIALFDSLCVLENNEVHISIASLSEQLRQRSFIVGYHVEKEDLKSFIAGYQSCALIGCTQKTTVASGFSWLDHMPKP